MPSIMLCSLTAGAARKRRSAMVVTLGAIVTFCLLRGTDGFRLSMVASRSPMGRSVIPGTAAGKPPASAAPAVPSDRAASALISQLAVAALKLRLHEQTHVGCDVTASASTMLRGRIGPVTVVGRGWGSRLGLTCRVIEATVDRCELDVGRAMTKRKLVLTVPAEGRAMAALDSADFGSFITHPLMKPPGIVGAGDGGRLEFSKEGVSIDPGAGVVKFLGRCMGRTWQFTLRRGSGEGDKALIEASLQNPSQADDSADWETAARQLDEATSKFFNEMVFELDGTFLSFSDMMLTSKGREPIIMLSLGILVKKFPSPGLDF